MQILLFIALTMTAPNWSKREPEADKSFCSSTSFEVKDGQSRPMNKVTQAFSEDGKTVRRESFIYVNGAFELQYARTNDAKGRSIQFQAYKNNNVYFEQTLKYEDRFDENLVSSFTQGPANLKTYRLRADRDSKGEVIRQAYVSEDGEWLYSTIFSKTEDGATQSVQTYDATSNDVQIQYTSADKRLVRTLSVFEGEVSWKVVERFFENGELAERESQNHDKDQHYLERSSYDQDQNVVSLQVWNQGELTEDYKDSNGFAWDLQDRMYYKFTKRTNRLTQSVARESHIKFFYDDKGRLIERVVQGTMLDGKIAFENREVISYEGCGSPSRSASKPRPLWKNLPSDLRQKILP